MFFKNKLFYFFCLFLSLFFRYFCGVATICCQSVKNPVVLILDPVVVIPDPVVVIPEPTVLIHDPVVVVSDPVV